MGILFLFFFYSSFFLYFLFISPYLLLNPIPMYIPKEKAARISFYKKKSAQTSSRRKLLDTYIVPTAEQVYAKYDQRLDLVKIKTRFVT